MKREKIYYLCHPYSGDIEANVKESIQITNDLLDKGYIVFNPLTHTHYLDKEKKRNPTFWYDFDLKFLERFDGIILSGDWITSKGCNLERQKALELKLEIQLYDFIKYYNIKGERILQP